MNSEGLIYDNIDIHELTNTFCCDEDFRWHHCDQHEEIINNLQKSNPNVDPHVFTLIKDRVTFEHYFSERTLMGSFYRDLCEELSKIKFNNFYEKILVAFAYPKSALFSMTDNIEENVELLSVALLNDKFLAESIAISHLHVDHSTGQILHDIGAATINDKKFNLARNSIAEAVMKAFERNPDIELIIRLPTKLYTDEFCQKIFFPFMMRNDDPIIHIPVDRVKDFFEFYNRHVTDDPNIKSIESIAFSVADRVMFESSLTKPINTKTLRYMIYNFPNTLNVLENQSWLNEYIEIVNDVIKDPKFFFYVQDNVENPAEYFKTILTNCVDKNESLATVPHEFAMLIATNYPELTLLMNVDEKVASAAVMCNNMMPVLAKACKRENDFPNFMEASNIAKNNGIDPEYTYAFYNCNNYYNLNAEEKIRYSTDALLLNTALAKVKLRRPTNDILDIPNKLDIILYELNQLGDSIISKYDYHDEIDIPYIREADYDSIELI